MIVETRSPATHERRQPYLRPCQPCRCKSFLQQWSNNIRFYPPFMNSHYPPFISTDKLTFWIFSFQTPTSPQLIAHESSSGISTITWKAIPAQTRLMITTRLVVLARHLHLEPYPRWTIREKILTQKRKSNGVIQCPISAMSFSKSSWMKPIRRSNHTHIMLQVKYHDLHSRNHSFFLCLRNW